MRKLSTIVSLTVLLVMYSVSGIKAQLAFGKASLFNDNWQFALVNTADTVIHPDSTLERTVNLPHDWSIEAYPSPALAACTGFLPGGIGWYRKTFTLNSADKGKMVYLYFEGVYNHSQVFVNGQLIGKRPNGYVSFAYNITNYLKHGQENTVDVCVDHSKSADSRWYTGSGIYRNVRLVTADPIHIAQWGVYCRTRSLDKDKATLAVETTIENNDAHNATLTVRQQLFDANGREIASATKKTTVHAGNKATIQQEFTVGQPKLWSVDQPYLYKLQTTLLQNNQVRDETTTTTGITQFTFDANRGFSLNGRHMKIKGVCLHHDAGILGAAVPEEVWKRRLTTLKTLGCNAIRMTHNPHAPVVYDLCDELGLLVLNEVFDEWEFPKRKWIQGWNVGTPGFDGAYDFFEEWGETDLADVVKRDRNHVAIFAWSIGNEVDYPNDPYSHPILDSTSISQYSFGGYRKEQPNAERLGSIAQRLVNVVKTHDPYRPVTAGLAGVAMSNATDYPFVLDLAGYNYTEDRYDADHKTYPQRIIYGSENRHDMTAWNAVKNKDFIAGQFLWTGIDYLGEAGIWPARGFGSGLLDLAGFVKPLGYFRQALWADTPVIYAGTMTTPKQKNTPPINSLATSAPPRWNYDDNQSVRVFVYTNAQQVRPELNGQAIGETKSRNDSTGFIYWDIPFEKGQLNVIGLDDHNNEITQYTLQTSQQPYALDAQIIHSPSTPTASTHQPTTLLIEVQVLDQNNVPVFLADNEVTCHIEGNAKLLGLENGNNKDVMNFSKHSRRVYNGKLIAYVQINEKITGQVRITFTAPWLQHAEVTY